MIRGLEEAERYLLGLIDLERAGHGAMPLALSPIRGLLARLGNPESGRAVIHVAGSKGKGSTALFAEGILRAAGLRVGTFTSPHLERWSERFRLCGAEVDGERLARAVERIRPQIDAMRADGDSPQPTWFDATTAIAWCLFQEEAVDAAVVEVGLGGRLDSTNAVTPRVGCITSIDLEHTEILGETLAEIAREKAGIAKPGVPLVVGRVPEEARRAIAACARDAGAPVHWLGEDFEVDEPSRRDGAGPRRIRVRDGALEVEAELRVLGGPQRDNAALALACVGRSGLVPADALASAASRGLAATALPGRLECFGERPWLMVDSAHTPASARALVAELAEMPARRRHLVVSISAGKRVDELLEVLLPGASRLTVTQAEPTRSLDVDALAERIRARAPELPLEREPDAARAVQRAREGLKGEDLLCVAGSVYLAGVARGVLGAGKK